MDGKIHRVPIIGKKAMNRDGAYIGYTNGIPAGWAENHTTGEKIKFIASGHVLSEEEKAQMQAERANLLQQRENQRILRHQQVAKESLIEFQQANEVTTHPYLENKGIQAINIKVNNKNQLLIPVKNIDNQIMGIQYINTDGAKFFKTGMEKKGNFCLLNSNQTNSKVLG